MSGPDFGGICHDLAQKGLALLMQSGLLLAFGLGLAASLRRHGPHVQSLVCRATLIAVVVAGVASFLLAPYTHSLWRITFPGTVVTPQAVPVVMEQAPPVPLSASDALPPSSAPHSFPASPSDAPPVLRKPLGAMPSVTSPDPHILPRTFLGTAYVLSVAVWAIGTVLLLLWLLVGQAVLLVLGRRSVRLTTGPTTDLMHRLCRGRPLPLLLSARVRSPFLGGFWRPAVFLPTSYAAEFDGPTLHAILAHELAHRDRNDNRWMLLTRLFCALFWVQPLCWVLARCLEQASEEACDAIALASGCPPRVYADCLLSLAERLTPSHLERAFGAGVVPFRSTLGRRVQHVLQKGSPIMPTLSPRLRLAAMVSVVFSCLSAVLFVSGNATSTQQTGGTPPQLDKAATECAPHLQAITRAVTQYAQDHQDRLPDSASWMDEIMPYVKNASVFRDPDARPTQQWSYAYNQSLSGVPLSRIRQANGLSQTVVVYDSERNYVLDPVEGVRNASNPGDALPYPGRHNGLNVFGFLDGHTQMLPTGQKPLFRPAAAGPHPSMPLPRRSIPHDVTSTKFVLVRAYEGKLTTQAEKAKKDWLDFKQSHPMTLSKAQIAQINTLINLRLQRNGLTGGMRMNIILHARHVARLAEIGPGQEAERRKWQTEITAIDAQTLKWEKQMPGIDQEITRQEALVRPFADDYLAVQFKQQQYEILRSENIIVREIRGRPSTTR